MMVGHCIANVKIISYFGDTTCLAERLLVLYYRFLTILLHPPPSSSTARGSRNLLQLFNRHLINKSED